MGIENVQGVRSDITEMLSKIREMSTKTNVFTGNNAAAINPLESGKNFEDVLSLAKNAVSQVNQVQAQSESLKNAYITGDGNISMSQVIVASQKSKLAFEGLMAVRNKILEAYKEIMSMPV